MFLKPITQNELIVIISKLKTNSSSGPDGISSKLIKNIHPFITSPLAHIINLIFKNGKLPYQWKESIITPVYKSGRRDDISNYRPISIINNFAKIFEHSLKIRLTKYLNDNQVLTDRQFGFMSGSSTENAVLDFMKEIIGSLDRSEKCLAIFLDLAKAFDTVDHGMLLDKLHNYGVRGPTYNVLKDYLSHRTQRVRINNDLSEAMEVRMGIPQGTVLGPILFLVYINSIGFINGFGGHIVSFADDTALVFTANNWNEVYEKSEKGLRCIQIWLSYNLLSLNVKKTKFITFSLLMNNQPCQNTLNIHGEDCVDSVNCSCPVIEKTESIRYLGIIVDPHIRWDDQVALCGEATQTTNQEIL